MGRFESYPETDALNDNDITLYNHTNNTNKITFINLVNLIKTKLQSIGIISIDTGVGLLSDGTITSNGTIKCDLKSETPASISSANISTVDNRQYAVGVDKDGHLSVNVPWEGSSTTYSAGSGINIINNTISTKLKSNTQSLLTASSMGSTSNRQYAVGLDSQNYLSVNIPWVEYSADKGIILNNNSHNLSANLKSYTQSALASTSMGSTANRQYAVGLDKDGYLSVNVPWEGGSTTYTAGSGIDISNNTIKVKLKSYTQSSLSSASITSIANKQYAVNLDSSGNLSVNVPWENTTYSSLSPVEHGTDVSLVTTGEKYNWNNTGTVKQITLGEGLTGDSTITSTGTIKVKLKSYTSSSLTATSMGLTANRQYAVGLDKDGYLSVNVPWTSGMAIDGSNAASEVTFSGKFTVGSRKANSTHGVGSVAEGLDITAEGLYSHAEGIYTNAIGDGSHAEGNSVIASGASSHAEGYSTTASGMDSHAEGNYTIAGYDNQHVSGTYNSNKSTTLFEVGNGSSSNRSNAFEVYSDGSLSTNNGTTKVKLENLALKSEIPTYSSLSPVQYGTDISLVTTGEKYKWDNGGTVKQITVGDGLYSLAGSDITSTGTIQVRLQDYTRSSFRAKDMGSITADRLYAVGLDYNGDLAVHVPWTSDMATDGSNADSEVTFSGKFTVGSRKANSTHGVNSVAEGSNIEASGDYSHAEGFATTASGDWSHAEGYRTTASQNRSHAEGFATTASGAASHAEGTSTKAIGYCSHAEGYSTIASGDYSHAEGDRTTASGNTSHTEGYSVTASGELSHAEGVYTTASGAYSHTEGQGTTASGIASHAEGNYGVASGMGSHVEGGILKGSPKMLGLYESQDNDTKIVKTNDTSFVSGKTYYVPPFVITSTGNANPKAMKWLELQSTDTYIYTTDTTVDSSKTYYNCNIIFGGDYSQTANGYFSHAEGNYVVASGNYSHAEGQNTIAMSSCSHAEGVGTVAAYQSQHVSGKYNSNKSETLFEVGNGTSSSRSNAFEVYSDGKLSTDNGITKVKLEDLATTSDVNSLKETLTNFEESITGEVVDSEPYVLRQGLGNLADMNLVGGSVAWNQLVRNGNFADTSNWTSSASSISMVNNKFTVTPTSGSTYFDIRQRDGVVVGIPAGHKLLFAVKASIPNFSKFKFVIWNENFGAAGYKEFAVNQSVFTSVINLDSTSAKGFYLGVEQTQEAATTFELCNIIDLTQLFGTTIADYIYSLEQATAGAGVAWFRKYFPNAYYGYQSGKIESVNPVSRKITGKNLNGTKYESGVDDGVQFTANQDETVSIQRVSTGTRDAYVPYTSFVAPFTGQVKLTGGVSNAAYAYGFDDALGSRPYTDSTMSAIQTPSNGNVNADNESSFFMIKGNTYHVVLRVSAAFTGSGVFKPMLRLASDTDSTYEPRTEYSYPFDPSIQLRGIPKLVDNKLSYDGDIYTADGTVTRKYGIVDLGSLTWGRSSWGAGYVFTATVSGKKYDASDGYSIGKILTPKYTTDGAHNAYTYGNNKTICDNLNLIRIVDNDYTDAATFKTAMSGVYLVYELATPITESANAYQNPQRAFSDGTEEFVDAGVQSATRDVSIPVGNNTTYQLNETLPPTEDYVDGAVEQSTREIIGLINNNGAKNLLPMTLAEIKEFNTSGTWSSSFSGYTYTINGVTFTVDTDGYGSGNVTSITANGTPSASQVEFYIAGHVGLKKGEYILNGAISNSKRMYFFNGSQRFNDEGSGKNFLISGSEIMQSVAIVITETANNDKFYPMIRLASDPDSTFEPYAMTNQQLTQALNPFGFEFLDLSSKSIASMLADANTHTLKIVAFNKAPSDAPTGTGNGFGMAIIIKASADVGYSRVIYMINSNYYMGQYDKTNKVVIWSKLTTT